MADGGRNYTAIARIDTGFGSDVGQEEERFRMVVHSLFRRIIVEMVRPRYGHPGDPACCAAIPVIVAVI